MELIAEIVIAALLVISGIFGLVGSFGLIRLAQPMQRLHAPTKATTLGVGGALIASMLWFAVFGDGLSFHELLITLFLFLTAPVTALFIAKSHLHRHFKRTDLPPTGTARNWTVFDDPEDPELPGEPAPRSGVPRG